MSMTDKLKIEEAQLEEIHDIKAVLTASWVDTYSSSLSKET